MTTHVIQTEGEQEAVARLVADLKLPFTLEITRTKKRSLEQNKLQHLWCKEIADHFGDRTPDDVRGYCKLTFGIPIMCMADEEYRKEYTKTLQPLPYQTRLAIMTKFDWPCTRLMTTAQLTDYLDAMARHFAAEGVRLTEPLKG